ncbi:MAG: hypothetical protein H0X28_03150 [Solirubrobacterales bacterium]|nr:hypothetical protein [Solirubrobacterales bacterium]
MIRVRAPAGAWKTKYSQESYVIDQPSKPVVAASLLAKRFDAGLTHVHHAQEHPEELRLVDYYGAVDTTWVVYGPVKHFTGEVIGQRVPWLFTGRPGSPACARPSRT